MAVEATSVPPLAMLAAERVNTRGSDLTEAQRAVVARRWAIAHNGVDMEGACRPGEQSAVDGVDRRLCALATDGEEGDAVELRDLSRRQRFVVHKRCEEYGFEHFSRSVGSKRVLVVKKPENWRWCFDHARSRESRKERKRRRPSPPPKPDVHCDQCGVSEWERGLCISVHFPDILCDDCITMEYAPGMRYDDHKWEDYQL